VPATPFDLEQLERLRQGGNGMLIKATYPRSLQHQRWYRGLCAVVADGIGWQPNALHKEIKFRAQLVNHIFMLKGGGVAVELKSTAFGELDEPDFRAYTDLAIEIIFRDFLPGVERNSVIAQVHDMVGPRPD
jgi:hypothetical protein